MACAFPFVGSAAPLPYRIGGPVTVVWQVYPPFHSSYPGLNSFRGPPKGLAQAPTDDDEIGLCSRLGWNSDPTETLPHTEGADWTLTAGTRVTGSWRRQFADDVSIAANGLGSAHADYLAAGDLGAELRDGSLSSRPAMIFEPYHLAQLMPPLGLTADYRLIADPGHNWDRAPACGVSAPAADMPPEMPPQVSANQGFDWNGWYAGGRIGLAFGSSNWSATQGAARAPVLNGSLDLFNPIHLSDGTGSYIGGLQAGYKRVMPSHFLLGLDADAMFPNTISGRQTFSSPLIGRASYQDTVLASGTVRGRLGYVLDPLLLYGTGGFAWAYDRLTRSQLTGTSTVKDATLWRLGWALGAGIELPLGGRWSAALEYQYSNFGRSHVTFLAPAQTFASDLALHSIQLGLNYHIGDDARLVDLSNGPTPLDLDWLALHGQTTFVGQYAFPFRAPYRGEHSLAPNQARETWDVTLYAGFRLWEGAEFWINPEVDQGFGLSDTLGLAGFPSGEAYKVGARVPYVRVPRFFLRQVVELGGETEEVAAGINQFPATTTANRVVLTVGKFAVTDIFDTNRYAHDSRNDFMNWALIDTGSFDYAADAWGYTYGAVAEWYQGPWTLRGGGFDLSTVPNSTALDPSFGQFQLIGEIEYRFGVWGEPGKVAVTPWLSRGRMGTYDDAIRLAEMTGQPADIAAVRRYRSRWGLAANLDQQVTPDWGLFLRTGFASPDVEPYEFTDIDRTVAAGAQITGNVWQRPDDTVGIAGILNSISGSHEAFLNAGGLGILIGDGRLPHPGLEQILETYYCLAVNAWRVTLDYQFVNNPAYNRDRGPVSVLGLRLHAQF
jgi:high affinity Mn2+ porin